MHASVLVVARGRRRCRGLVAPVLVDHIAIGAAVDKDADEIN
jgi:hypothetical protein